MTYPSPGTYPSTNLYPSGGTAVAGPNSVTATPESFAVPPRVRLDVNTDQSTVVLHRVAQDGTRTLVRSYDGDPFPVSGGSLVAYDPEAPIGQPVTYTADGLTDSNPVTLATDDVWLVHPGVPSRSQPVAVAAMSERSHQANQAVRYPLGARYPITASDGQRKAATYNLTIRTNTLNDMGAVEVLLNDLAPLLLSVPAGKQWGQVTEYVTVGAVTCGRVVRWGPHPMREWLLPCTVVDRPAGGSQVDNTYAKSSAAYPTYADRYAAHATYGEAFDPK